MSIDKSINVLIVDDFASMRRIISTCLKQLGFNYLFEAIDGEDALRILGKRKVGLIVSDWNMPKMNGLELLKFVRADDKHKHIPFLMLTTEGHKENVVEAVQAGVSNYIVKPFTLETLKTKLDKIFA